MINCCILSFVTILTLLSSCTGSFTPDAPVFQKWHTVTLRFEGPESSEEGQINPFTDYRMNVTFTKGDKSFVVPGFYAADGNAAETGASSGNIWMVRFSPDEEGLWDYQVSFREGTNIAVTDDTGKPSGPEGAKGQILVVSSDKVSPDFRSKGRLCYVGERYLQFA